MKVTAKGQVTIPKLIRERYGLYAGTAVRVVEKDHHVVVEKESGQDAWDGYYGYLKPYAKKRWRTNALIRALRGPRP